MWDKASGFNIQDLRGEALYALIPEEDA